MTGYGPADVERFVDEGGSPSRRAPFARDRARVLHSAALRRLAATTQVVVAARQDFPRTRLTHTLEVAQIGRELAAALGADPDLVDTACLSHDLGHPPFGHNGEAALDVVARDIGGFEGNAQSLRVLTRLEAKVLAEDGTSVGLNLTRASLDAAAKYPWPRPPAGGKFGAYAEDLPILEWIRVGAPAGRRCIEAQIMDWADDVAYSVHDVEDALHGGHMTMALLSDPVERGELVALARSWYAPGVAPERLSAALDRLQALPVWPTGFDGSIRSLVALKGLTSALIARFCAAAESATLAAAGPGPLTRYGGDLVVPEPAREEVAVMKAVAARYVMLREGAEQVYVEQRAVLTALVGALLEREGRDLQPWLRPSFEAARDDDDRLRVVIDQVASLTDVSAVDWHRRLAV